MSKLKLVSSLSLVKKSPIAKPKQLLIADANVKDVDVLTAGLKLGVECWILRKDSNIQELLKMAFCDNELSALHLLGHGMPGAITLGNVKIDIANWSFFTRGNSEIMQTLPEKISSWQKKPLLSNKWDICFWSCNTGEGSKGKAFIQYVAGCTGANVYASSGLVGHSECGGSWQLNVVAYPGNRVAAVKN